MEVVSGCTSAQRSFEYMVVTAVNKIRIRPACPEDARGILAIYSPYVENTPISFEYTPPTLSEFEARIQNVYQEYPYLVCEESGVILAYAYATRHMERAAYRYNVETTIYLSPHAQGRGIATVLYEALLDLLRLQGMRNAYALITSSNQRSLAFHKKLGYQLIGILRGTGYKFDQWHDVTWLEKTLLQHDAFPDPPKPIHNVGAERIQRVLELATHHLRAH